jgi:hypothetical protein
MNADPFIKRKYKKFLQLKDNPSQVNVFDRMSIDNTLRNKIVESRELSETPRRKDNNHSPIKSQLSHVKDIVS